MISFISTFEIINVVILDPKIFFLKAASVTVAAAVNPNGIKTLLANNVNTFFLKGKPVLVMDLKVYLKILLIVLFLAIEFLIILY